MQMFKGTYIWVVDVVSALEMIVYKKQKQTRETKALVIKTLGTQCKDQNEHRGQKRLWR